MFVSRDIFVEEDPGPPSAVLRDHKSATIVEESAALRSAEARSAEARERLARQRAAVLMRSGDSNQVRPNLLVTSNPVSGTDTFFKSGESEGRRLLSAGSSDSHTSAKV